MNTKNIGIIKWFDAEQNPSYRFLYHPELGDVYFDRRFLLPPNRLEDFIENRSVVFEARKSSKVVGKFEGHNVRILKITNDLNLLYQELCFYLKFPSTESPSLDYKNSLIRLVESITIENSQQSLMFMECKNNFFEEKLSSYFIESSLKFGQLFFPNYLEQLIKLIQENITADIAHELWLKSFWSVLQIDYVSDFIIESKDLEKSEIFQKCNQQEINDLLSKILEKTVAYNFEKQLAGVTKLNALSEKYNSAHNEFKKIIFDACDDKIKFELWLNNTIDIFNLEVFLKYTFKIEATEKQKALEKGLNYLNNIEYYRQIEKIEAKLDVELKHSLWLQNLLPSCQINYISDQIFEYDSKKIDVLFDVATDENKRNLFQKLLDDTSIIESNEREGRYAKVLDLSNSYHPKSEEFLLTTLKQCDDYIKLKLWLAGYHEVLEFENFKHYCITLNSEDQIKFVKKALLYKLENKIDLSLEQFTSINVLDYEVISFAKENYDLEESTDYSVSILLHLLNSLSNNISIITHKDKKQARAGILQIVLNKIKNAKDLMDIKGFYSYCEGRTFAKQRTETINGEHKNFFDLERNRKYKAKNHLYCDSRQAPNICERTKLEYWWCANQKCYNPCRSLKGTDEWQNYTIEDFLVGFDVVYDKKDYEIYLNLINKINRFLPHMKCRKCEHILYPKVKTTYAFYGVNLFQCKNSACEANETIYISHCSNGLCEQTIDSRDNVKCKPSGFGDKCGWYVCNNCNACCNRTQLQLRKESIESRALKTYNCHLEGHKDLGIICCNKCGNSMEFEESRESNYKEVTDWLANNEGNYEWIRNYGVGPLGNKWYNLRQGNLTSQQYFNNLNYYQTLGFNIPNIDNGENIQFISSPLNYGNLNNELLKCTNHECGHKIDLNSDIEQKVAMKKYHKKKFEDNPTINET